MVTRHVSFCFPFVKKGRIRGFPSISAGIFVEIDEAKCLLSSEKCVLLSPQKSAENPLSAFRIYSKI